MDFGWILGKGVSRSLRAQRDIWGFGVLDLSRSRDE